MNTKTILLILGIISLTLTILFCGVVRDPEFNEPTIFFKHRPTLKLHFYSPVGESDLTLEDLSEKQRNEELAYQEFIEKQEVYTKNLNRLWFLPPLLIQLTLTFLSFGMRSQIQIRLNNVLLHMLINIIPSVLGIAFLLHFENLVTGIGLAIVLMLNIWTLKIIEKKRMAHGAG